MIVPPTTTQLKATVRYADYQRVDEDPPRREMKRKVWKRVPMPPATETLDGDERGGGERLSAVNVVRWGRFLLAGTDPEFEQLAAEDPIMQAGKDALERLSQDPEAYRLARERADEIKLYQIARRDPT